MLLFVHQSRNRRSRRNITAANDREAVANVPQQQRGRLGRDPETCKAAAGGTPSEEFLEAWKRESDECARIVFATVWIEGPSVSGALKQAAVDSIMRAVWSRVDARGREELLRKNWDEVEKYTADLVDKTVAERWKRVAPPPR